MKHLTRRTATALVAAALTVGGLTATAQAAPAAPAAPAGGDPTLTDVYIWATNVNLRERPTRQSTVLAVRSKYWLDAVCQTQGETVRDPAVGTNNWWTAVQEFAGSDIAWVNNLYLRGGQKIAGVPDC
ncbi:peptidase M23 [Streptomyces sp. 15-116A]|uniref:peptidase M23 n=1 Tax=Streptomyces sp. 15-116A TaxID=2259035 RepID=UPI0021B1F938|nr:peptidase M23 [Streptomyces sp. 15-116A]MCT7355379.1 peptidase M23 [Streptomyces sp. 15-116A]